MLCRLQQGAGSKLYGLLSTIASVSIRGKSFPSLQAEGYSTEAPDRKNIVRLLDNRDDPEVDSAVKLHLKSLFNEHTAAVTPISDDKLDLTSQIERKYIAAQVIEYGLQTIAVPLACDHSVNKVPIKRYVAEVLSVAKKAGFEDPIKEVEKRLREKAASVDSVKEFLLQIKAYVTADFHAALLDALQAVEAEIGSALALDASSPGYKKFAIKVQELAKEHKVAVELLNNMKKMPEDEVSRDRTVNAYLTWLQASRAEDAAAEIDALQTHAITALDSHLSKTSEQVKKEAELGLQQLMKKVETAKGAKWAQHVQADMKYVSWFDSNVAA